MARRRQSAGFYVRDRPVGDARTSHRHEITEVRWIVEVGHGGLAGCQ
jgi:hypothetical protein